MFKPIVFDQLLTTNMLLCVIGFQLVEIQGFFEKLTAAFFGVAVIVELFVYAFGGQIILNKSSEIGSQLYDMDKEVVMVIAKAQQPLIIKAWLYEANLPTFTAILNSAASLITILKSFI